MKVEWLRQEIEQEQKKLEHVINCTLTGERRNLLTEANIHIMLGLEKLKQAEKTP